MRAIFRLLSLAALVVATIAGVVDAVQSVAASEVVLTPLGAAWEDVSPATLAAFQSMLARYLPAFFTDPVAVFLLAQPATAVLLVLAFLFHLLGYRRRRPSAGFFRR
jgi:hypothetical protein